MSQLRLRIELNKGGHGISMDKLAEITTETERFLRMIVEDVSRQATGKWIARDFENNSVDFTAAYVSETITPAQIQECRQALAYTMNERTDVADFSSKIRRSTLLQYAKIAKPIAPDEAVHFALFDVNSDLLTEHHVLSKERSLEIEQRLQLTDRIQYDGSTQGTIIALFKGTNPHFRLRELYSEEWFPCYFSYRDYDKVIHALESADTIVHVAGSILASRTTRRPISMQVKKIVNAEPYLEGDLEKFIGCAPHATGDLSTEEFIDMIRKHEELVGNGEET
ncbi:MAG TPA: hypothetical protein VF658_21770 [Pyrinomonadaceae bacterium]|jgi:hypothetical protein